MPQFHETGYGRKFFDKQLPDLIKAMERIANALEEQNELTKEKEKETGMSIYPRLKSKACSLSSKL